jgi:hypothetical protein
MNNKSVLGLLGSLVALPLATAQVAAPALDENCVINVLNRTVQVAPDGGWIMPNVPSNMGRIRARATCTQGNQTRSGQTDYFTVTLNGVVDVGRMQFEDQEQVPVLLAYTESGAITLATVGATHQLGVRATYPNGSVREVTAASNGTNYRSTNAAVASVDAEGLVTAHSSGVVLITARKDEVVAIKQIAVNVAGDKDRDGLPDDFEQANGLDPNDPIDAQEDQDSDGLTALQEFQLGTNLRIADSDGDGIQDGEEVAAGVDGFITNPLNADTDGDGLRDGLEVLAGSSPTDPNDRNLEGALDRITVNPPSVALVFNGIETEVSFQLAVTGILIDGTTIDLTARNTGTTYTSSDLSIVSFGTTDGQIFGGTTGSASVTVANVGKQFVVAVTVENFQPAALSSINIPGYANNVDVAGDYAYVAAGAAGLQVLDVSDRAHPAIVASLDTDGTAIDVRIVGHFAYVADGAAGLKVIDIADPLSPTLVGQAQTDGIAQDLKVDLQFAYVADGANGVVIFDVSDPADPVAKGHVDGIGTALGIDAQGTRAVVVANTSLYVLDVSDRAAPLPVGTVDIGTVKDVVLRDNYAYVAAYNTGYRVIRLTNPAAPSIVGGDASFNPRDVELVEGFAFFAEQLFPNVIALVNVQDPENAAFQSVIDLLPFGDYAGTGIALDGSYAYVTEEFGAVGDNFRATGNTRLFIAQYRRISDSFGVPPTVAIRAPDRPAVEGATLSIDVDATDDVGVRDIKLAVNGVVGTTDSSRPYQLPAAIPFGATSVTLSATATDFGGNAGTAQLVLPVLADADHDGLSDQSEANVHHTDPNDSDSDDDGLGDGREIVLGTNPLAADSDGDGRNDSDELDAGTDPLNPDITPPTVVSTNPANNATAVPENGAVRVTFNEPLQAGSVNPANLQVMQSGTGTPAAGSVVLMPNGVDLLFTPSVVLADFTLYNVVVSGVRDRAGNVLAAPFQFSYTTGNVADSSAPQIAASTPFAGALDVPTNATVIVVMNEDLNPLSVGPTSIRVLDQDGGGGGVTIPGVTTLAADARTLTWVPNASLSMRHRHLATVAGVRDLFGNTTGGASFGFTTVFNPDATPPQIRATSIQDGMTGAPTNVTLSVRFNETINRLALGGIVLRQGANVISTQRQVTADSAGTVVTLLPTPPLAANTSYVFSIGGVQDLSGNTLATPRTVNFATGSAADAAAPTVVARTPLLNATNVPRNTVLEVRVSERLNPVTVNAPFGTFVADGASVPVTVSLSADGTVVRYTTVAPLPPRTIVQGGLNGVRDLAGNSISGSVLQFTTGDGSDTAAPVVQLQSIADAASGIPINGRIVLVFDAPLADRCVTSQTVQLVSNGASVAGTTTLSADRRTLTFTPTAVLSANTAYALQLQGVCDLAGNTLDSFSTGFTTSASATPDTTAPGVSITPAQSATNVPVTTPIVFTFNEPMDVTTLAGSIQVSVSGGSEVAGTLNVSGNTVTFNALDPLPGSKVINVVVNGARDLAGNQLPNTTRSFTTGAAGDSNAPHVVSMVPNDGLVDVATGTPIVLTFSESLDPATITNNTFALFVNGAFVSLRDLSRSADNRTVVLTANLPAASVVSVIVSNEVRDLSGNAMNDFVGAFTTALPRDTTTPQVVTQFPGRGAFNVLPQAPIVLYMSEPMNAATLAGAVHVAQGGLPVPGATTVSANGQVITFQPAAGVFQRGTTVEIFLDNTALDSNGVPIAQYQGSFGTAVDPASVPPLAVSFAPSFPATLGGGVPVNATLDILMSEPLDPASIDNGSVVLREQPSRNPVPAEVSLRAGDQILRVHAQSLLAPSQQYSLEVQTTIRDSGGQRMASPASFNFTTGSVAVADTVAPHVVALGPPHGSTGIGVNAQVHARFDESINTLSIGVTTQQPVFGSVFWSDNNRELSFVRHTPYAPNAQVTESVASAEDFAGNAVAGPASTTFTTGATPDAVGSNSFQMTPPTGTQNVPVNAVVRLRFTEQVDPVSVNPTSIAMRDVSLAQSVPLSVQLEPDGRTVTLVPVSAYAPSHGFSITALGIRDLAGNTLAVGPGASSATGEFTTALTPDTVPPSAIALSMPDQATGVPTNSVIQVLFDEPVDVLQLDGVVLTRNGVAVPATLQLSGDQRLITFKLVQPLAPNASYALSVSGVRDLSGNTLAADRSVSFTAETGIDVTNPAIAALAPAVNATNVPRNVRLEVRLNDRFNAVSTTPETIRLRNAATGQFVNGTISFSPDRSTLRFTPSQPLGANQAHTFTADYTDLAGNAGNAIVSFTTGAATDSTPPQVLLQSIADGATGIAVNGRIAMQFDSALTQQCVNGQSVQLTTGGVTIAGSILLSADRTRFTFTPQSPLAANTSYTLRLRGLCDTAGNVSPDFTTSFTTSSSATPDTAGPTVTMTPAPNSTNVPVTTPIALTFNEPIDVTSLAAGIRIGISGTTDVAGTLSVSANVVTFTPSVAFPQARTINVQINGVTDLAGNPGGASFVFTTAATGDVTVPQVLSVSPADGLVDIGPGTPIVLTFSKSLNPATATSANLTLFANGNIIVPTISPSQDNRIFVLTAPLPPASIVSIIATSDVRDLSGNRLADFVSAFTTASSLDTARPSITSQAPASGLLNVRRNANITLFASEPLLASTVAAALHVAQNGVPVAGTFNLSGNGRLLSFHPNQQWSAGALVEVFLDSNATDTAGNPLNGYNGNFRVLNQSATLPQSAGFLPNSIVGGMPINAPIDVLFNKPLDPATVNASNVILRDTVAGQPVAATVSLIKHGLVIRIQPQSLLLTSRQHAVDLLSNLRDSDGNRMALSQTLLFSTNSNATPDTQAPRATRMSPPNGASGVGVNAQVHASFDEPMNPFSMVLNPASGGTLFWSDNNRDLRIVWQEPYAPNAEIVESVEQAQDVAGNAVLAPFSTTFTIGDGADFTAPALLDTTPFQNATNVPVNPLIRAVLNDQLDPVTVNASGVFLQDMQAGSAVAGSLTLEPDGRSITLVPSQALPPSRTFNIKLNGVRDLAGNLLPDTTRAFTSGSAADTQPPVIASTTVLDGQTGVALNGLLQVRFDEAVNSQKLSGVTLRRGGVPVPATLEVSGDHRTLTFKPVQLLSGNTTYVLGVSGVEDLSRNVLAGSQTITFTTGTRL